MRKQLLAVIVLSFLASFTAMAQQDPLYSLYLNNPISINPAYTGLNDNFNAVLGFRKQWSGIDGSPTTINFTAHSSIAQNRMGAGIIIVNDQVGEITTTQATATYSYKVKLSEDRVLSFGMQGGILNYKTKELNLQDPSDETFALISQVKPMIGAGVMLKSEKYLVGLSVPRLLNSSFTASGSTYTAYKQHMYLFGSYIIPLSERILFKPSTLLKYTGGAPVSVDLNANINIDRNYTVGIYTRNFNAYGLLAQVNFLEYLRLSYAFEIPTNKSIGTQYNTNEVNLGLKLSVFQYHNRSITNF